MNVITSIRKAKDWIKRKDINFIPFISSLLVFLVVMVSTSVYLLGRYPEKHYSYPELLNQAAFQNYTILDNGLVSSTMDPMIIIELPTEGNDIKSVSIEITETSGYDSYWSQIFLYDDSEWTIRDFWVHTGTTDYILTRGTRTDDYNFLRLDLCNIEQVFMSLGDITINSRGVLIKLSFAIGLLSGICVLLLISFAVFLIKKRGNRAGKAGIVEQKAPEISADESLLLKMRRSLGVMDYIMCAVLSLAFSAAPAYIKDGVCRLNLSLCLSVPLLFIVFIFLAVLFRTMLARRNEMAIPASLSFQKLLYKKPANKKSSPKLDLIKEKIAGGR